MDKSAQLRLTFVNIDLSLSVLEGMLKDQIYTLGFDVINYLDFRQWLLHNGANEKYTVNGPLVMSLYNLVFAFEQGDTNKPNIEAGTVLRSLLRMTTGYIGSFMYEMNGSMGDVVFEPFYKVLKDRGVKFEFFAQVEDIVPGDNHIDAITITKQLPNTETYQPFVNIDNIDCWPSRPNEASIDDKYQSFVAEHYQMLETAPHQWQQAFKQHFNQGLPTETLTYGKDFDLVIFGASIASLPIIAPKLLAQDENMALMVKKVATNATQAVQTFSSQTLAQAGWIDHKPCNPIASGLLRPFDTWSVMNQLIPYEQWPQTPAAKVNTIHYHCCVLPTNNDNQAQATDKVTANASAFIQGPFKGLLPEFNSAEVLNAPERHYFRANIYGSERYVVSHVGTSEYRLKTDGTQFNNLYLAGDWTQNGINLGCIEAAVTSGLMACRAICGFPSLIEGEKDV